MQQVKRYWIYGVAAVIGLAMIVLSKVMPEWDVDAQLSLIGQVITFLTTVLAWLKSNPNKVTVVPNDQLGMVQDVAPTADETYLGPDPVGDDGETVEGPNGQ